MKEFVFFKLLLFINHLTVRTFSNHLNPSTIFFMFLFRRMTTTTSEWVMFHLDSFFSFNKSLLNFLSTENISIKMLAEYLCSLIFNCILRINCNYITNAHLKKCLTNSFWIARINKDNLWQKLYTCPESFYNLVSFNNLKSS